MESGAPVITHRIRGLKVSLDYSVEDLKTGKLSSVTENRLKKNNFVVWVADREGQRHRFILDNSFEADNMDPEMLQALLKIIGQEHLGLLKPEEPERGPAEESDDGEEGATRREA